MVELSISKDILVTLPRVLFDGKIIIVDNHIKSNIAISKLRKETLLGIDTETRPSFRRGVIHKVALLQISTFNECYLFRTNKIGMPQGVLQLLQDERVTKIGLSLRDDMLKLGEICNINPKGLIDLQDFVKKYGIFCDLPKGNVDPEHIKLPPAKPKQQPLLPPAPPTQQPQAPMDEDIPQSVWDGLLGGLRGDDDLP